MRAKPARGHALCFFRCRMHDNSAPEDDAEGGQTRLGVVGGTQLFNRFTLQKVLGRGGMGIVWLARDDRLDRLVALKLVPEAVCFDASAHEDLKRETRKSLMLTHPNIVRIFDFMEDERTAAISMEYVDGATFSSLRVQKPSKCFEVRELIPWVTSLCDALAYAHDSARLVHRDLKPANLMANSRSELKITDFGIACTLRESMHRVSVSTSSGTLNYMSPQQMLGEDPSPSDDVYSLGATLYEMLSSKPPFYGGDVASQVRDIIAPTVTQRRTKLEIFGEPIPKHWEETIAACLAKNPEHRPRTAAGVARRLRLSGPIRLADVEEHHSQPWLQNLTPRPVVLIAGVLALTLAMVTLFHRQSKPTLAEDAAKIQPSGGYAMEVIVKPTAVPARDVGAPPAKLAVATQSSQAPAPSPNNEDEQNTTLQLTTNPAGAAFAIYPGLIAGKVAPAREPLRRGTTPQSIGDLPPGRYTLFFHNEGWPEDRAEVSLRSGETLPVDYTFPHGTATITSNPDGVEILLGERSLGRTPLTVDLPVGKQVLVSRYPDLPKRTKTVIIDSTTPATVSFQLRASGRSSSRPTPTPSSFDKLGNSLKKIFSSHSSPTPKTKR
jgi:serine/threonine protein kinase